MAATVSPGRRDEMVGRYRFQLELQLHEEAHYHRKRLAAFARLFKSRNRTSIRRWNRFCGQAWRGLKKVLQNARDVTLPALKNFKAGEGLSDIILERSGRSRSRRTGPARLVLKLVAQLDAVYDRCSRGCTNASVGGILECQEMIAAAWQARFAPVEAEVVEDAIDAEVIDAEPVDAEVVTPSRWTRTWWKPSRSSTRISPRASRK